MKKAVLRKLIYRFISLVLFLTAISYISYKATDLWWVSILAGLIGVLIWDKVFQKGSKRISMIQPLLDAGFPDSIEDPILEYGNQEKSLGEGWEKGFGFTDTVSQPMWSKVDENGISLFYSCIPDRKPILIPWDKIFRVTSSEHSTGIDEETMLLARVFVFNIDMVIYIPWNSFFDEYVPDRVAFDNENS